jgi:uncharacterized Zn finger protein (UPF0148 family)
MEGDECPVCTHNDLRAKLREAEAERNWCNDRLAQIEDGSKGDWYPMCPECGGPRAKDGCFLCRAEQADVRAEQAEKELAASRQRAEQAEAALRAAEQAMTSAMLEVVKRDAPYAGNRAWRILDAARRALEDGTDHAPK